MAEVRAAEAPWPLTSAISTPIEPSPHSFTSDEIAARSGSIGMVGVREEIRGSPQFGRW